MEYKVEIAGVDYTEEEINSCRITRPLFEKFSVGNACSATIEMEFEQKAEIPTIASVTPYAKESEDSEWLKQGVFFADTIENDGYTTKIVGYDSMLKAEVVYIPTGNVGTWPKQMASVAQEISTDVLGIPLDERTAIPNGYMLEYPNDRTCRELLCAIAAACGGNWIITAKNTLLLVPLFSSMPPETNFLITEHGDPLAFPDGTRLIV